MTVMEYICHIWSLFLRIFSFSSNMRRHRMGIITELVLTISKWNRTNMCIRYCSHFDPEYQILPGYSGDSNCSVFSYEVNSLPLPYELLTPRTMWIIYWTLYEKASRILLSISILVFLLKLFSIFEDANWDTSSSNFMIIL